MPTVFTNPAKLYVITTEGLALSNITAGGRVFEPVSLVLMRVLICSRDQIPA